MAKTKTLPAAPREVRVNRKAMERNASAPRCNCRHCQVARAGESPLPVFTVTEPDGTILEAQSVKILGPCQLVYEQGQPVPQGCGVGPRPVRAFIRTDAELEIKL